MTTNEYREAVKTIRADYEADGNASRYNRRIQELRSQVIRESNGE
jgi:hypothetical protein